MKTQIQHNLSPNDLMKTCIQYGLIGTVAYALYFILMRVIGLAQVTELRFLNYIIMCIVSFYALKHATLLNGRQPQFLREMSIIFLTCGISFIAFGIFILFYSLFDPFLINTFIRLYPGSIVFGNFSAPVFIASEGIGLSSVVALGMTFFFRMYREKRKEKISVAHPELI